MAAAGNIVEIRSNGDRTCLASQSGVVKEIALSAVASFNS
jgi:hypothetical protein